MSGGQLEQAYACEETSMAAIQTTANPALIEEGKHPAVNWGAVIAGGVATAALMLLLLAFGAGVGFSVVSPWAASGVSAAIFSLGAGLFLIVVAMLSSTIGGFIAGRLRTKWVGVHTHEVYFRDTAHGFLAWALATVLGAGFLAAAASNIAGGASPGLAPAANVSATAGSGGHLDYYVDALLRPNPAAIPNATDPGAARREIAGILTKGIADGDVAEPDRTYMAQVIAARTGLSQADADKRVSNVIDQAKTDLDSARKAAGKLSLWFTAALLV